MVKHHVTPRRLFIVIRHTPLLTGKINKKYQHKLNASRLAIWRCLYSVSQLTCKSQQPRSISLHIIQTVLCISGKQAEARFPGP